MILDCQEWISTRTIQLIYKRRHAIPFLCLYNFSENVFSIFSEEIMEEFCSFFFPAFRNMHQHSRRGQCLYIYKHVLKCWKKESAKLFQEGGSWITKLNCSIISSGRMILLVLQSNVFRFSEKLYKQIRGTGMGMQMAVNYANIFLDNFENKIPDVYQ